MTRIRRKRQPYDPATNQVQDVLTLSKFLPNGMTADNLDPCHLEILEILDRVRISKLPPKKRAAAGRSSEISLGVQGFLAPLQIDDPIETGAKMDSVRSTRDDPLADLHARHMIDEAQYQAGRAFQHDFETAERGPRAIDFTREAVDGGLMPEPITEAQRASGRQLAIVYRALGQDGSAIVHGVLVHNRTRKQIAESRGLVGKRWEEYYGMRFRECLDCLALVYGFSMEKR